MNIVITLAGHSRRFKEAGYTLPKFLIPIHGKPMIAHVIDMFSPEDHFYFVANKQQVEEFPNLADILKEYAKKSHLTIIEPHEKGPTYSAMQIANINDGPVIITYCDFIVTWDYARFQREVATYQGAAPCFKGTHPASFGDTYYAYVRVNAQNEMLELREKQSFTKNRHEEYASTGIYYFESWSLFKECAQKLMNDGFQGLKEGYVSLLMNILLEKDKKVKITEVDKFICWGTPEDLEQYLFWDEYFTTNINHTPQHQIDQLNLIPMAGKGSRFKEFGYRARKPLIKVCNRPMIEFVCQSFPPASDWVFLPRAEDSQKHPIDGALKNFNGNIEICPVKHDTTGQAATCLLGKKHINPNRPIFIASCDYQTVYDEQKWLDLINDPNIDGAIWTFRLKSILAKNPKAFAYCVTDKTNRVLRVVEKDTISETPHLDPLVVGSFWFRKGEDFIWACEEAIRQNLTVNNEHYVGNSINLLIEQGKKIVIFPIEQWISLGDPFELQVFDYWQEFFEDMANGKSISHSRR